MGLTHEHGKEKKREGGEMKQWIDRNKNNSSARDSSAFCPLIVRRPGMIMRGDHPVGHENSWHT